MAKKCENCGNEHIEIVNKDGDYVCGKCGRNTERMKALEPKTNADRIRAMSDEELAEFLCTHEVCNWDSGPDDIPDIIKWLQSEAVQI